MIADRAVDRCEDAGLPYDQGSAWRRRHADFDRTLVGELAAGQGIERLARVSQRRLIDWPERREPDDSHTHSGYRGPRQDERRKTYARGHSSLPMLLGFSMHLIDFSEFTNS